jgi:ABC-type uncharacterized transport system permease subunit
MQFIVLSGLPGTGKSSLAVSVQKYWAIFKTQVTNSFAYPADLFSRSLSIVLFILLFTILPAAFIGAVPAEFVRTFTWSALAQLLAAALIFLSLAVLAFQRGLRRYESGSAIQIQV